MKIINQTTKNVAILYADSDAPLKQELCKHLKPMQRNGQIALIESAERSRVPHLDIILTLISPAFLADDLLVNAAQYALSNQQTGQRVIPIILRPVNLESDMPGLARLQSLPKNEKSVMEQNRDKAFTDIAAEIRLLVVGRG